jgi:hypothetical protein
MAAAKLAQTVGSYLLVALIILGFVALLVFAGLFIRQSFPTGAPTATTSRAAEGGLDHRRAVCRLYDAADRHLQPRRA